MFNSTIGIEIEFLCCRCEGVEKIKEILSKYSGWKLEYEDSLEDTLELISPPLLYSQNKEKIQKIFGDLDYLEKNGFISTRDKRNNGIHFHFDIYNFEIEQIKKLIYNWISQRDFFLSKVSPLRINNEWCLPFDNLTPNFDYCESVGDIIKILQSQNGKCYELNLKSYYKFKTVEFRFLESSTDFNLFEKILINLWKLINLSF